MLEDALLDLTNRGDIVLDPFLGSGSTLIAAEKAGRICRGVELDPLYVDVIIRRYEAARGSPAILAETGEPFAKVAERRRNQGRDRPLSPPAVRAQPALVGCCGQTAMLIFCPPNNC